ncbi:deoxyribonuclease I [Stutzerimonas zhaodongensis]|uniref:Deoxyribonuclease I n=1 Tax=Stutzerimonas zhaodongensis TaxID=1176257 RepID=A0A3M2I1D7_9GAMM|nr:endonuclease [Stutzerimonas zhaodongensis]MCQ4314465.1 endonuclease [Stutzerimonas zhaodongensis]RMH91984.1 deoxyribonuclease I [Stutzerimonas zhaodongensis]
MNRFVFVLLATFHLVSHAHGDAPATFLAAKVMAKQQIFFDQALSDQGELYCGCKWEWTGKSGGRIDPKSCGYETRAQKTRADRIEWEHIVPAWIFGHQRQCWQNGGRKNCVADDPVFRAMEADLFNLYPSVGEVNGDRSNYQYAMVTGVAQQYGACPTRVDFKRRAAEPRNDVKGLVARSTFYMYDRYGLSMSRQQQQLLMAWDEQYPVSVWEKEWNRRTAKVMGHPNPFVTGARSWSLGHKPSREGIVSAVPARAAAAPSSKAGSAGVIIGNRNSKVYHLAEGCPSYDKVAPKNQVPFRSETEAAAAGYRKAGNCH